MTIPNQITTFRLPLHLLTCWSLQLSPITTLILYITNIALDKADGIYARQKNQRTDFGKYYDIAVDRTIQTTMLLTLLIYTQASSTSYYLFMLILARDFLLTGIRQFAAEKNLFLKGSLYGKTKAAFEMVTIYALLILAVVPTQYSPNLRQLGDLSLILTVCVGTLSLYKYLHDNYILFSQNW